MKSWDFIPDDESSFYRSIIIDAIINDDGPIGYDTERYHGRFQGSSGTFPSKPDLSTPRGEMIWILKLLVSPGPVHSVVCRGGGGEGWIRATPLSQCDV